MAIAIRVSVSARAAVAEQERECATCPFVALAELLRDECRAYWFIEDALWEQKEREWQEWEESEEGQAWRERTIAWLDDPANYGHENYSDIFKDVYGYRPRW